MTPLLSIIIPVYNVERYLPICIKSLLDQRQILFELILVDDGSTDKSSVICDVFATQDSRIRTFHIKNGGVSKARNYGLDQARGEYILFIDSDDFVSKDYLEVIKMAIKSNTDITIFNYTRWINDTQLEVGRFRLTNGIYNQTDNLYKEAVNLEIVSLSVCCAVFKRSIIESHHIRFNENMKTCEDFMFSLIYYQYVQNYSVINKPIYYYRQNIDSATGKRALQHGLDYQIVFDEINNIFTFHLFDKETRSTFERRWTRWIIDLVANYKKQNINNKDIEKVIYSQTYYSAILKFIPYGALYKAELWLLKRKYSEGIYLYSNIINHFKRLLKHYKL